jgi:hypothetical protein
VAILASDKEKRLKLRSVLRCVQCSQAFTGMRSDQKHCSSACRIKYSCVRKEQQFVLKNEEKVCIVCNKLFVKKREKRKLCGLVCRNAYSKFINLRPPLFKPILSNCLICGQAYTKNSGNSLVCGVSCKRAAKRAADCATKSSKTSLCKYCEKPSDRGTTSVVCTSCFQEEAQKRKNLQGVICKCVVCNTPFVARATKRRFCDDCRKKRPRGPSRSVGSVGSKLREEHLALSSLSSLANMLGAAKNFTCLQNKLEGLK